VRLARLILSSLKLRGAVAKNGEVRLDLGLSQSEIGLLIGASRPKVNLALTALEDMGAVTRSGNGYVCDPEVLSSFADMDASGNEHPDAG
jgi:DNA-binding IclR family transcriptional regulator